MEIQGEVKMFGFKKKDSITLQETVPCPAEQNNTPECSLIQELRVLQEKYKAALNEKPQPYDLDYSMHDIFAKQIKHYEYYRDNLYHVTHSFLAAYMLLDSKGQSEVMNCLTEANETKKNIEKYEDEVAEMSKQIRALKNQLGIE